MRKLLALLVLALLSWPESATAQQLKRYDRVLTILNNTGATVNGAEFTMDPSASCLWIHANITSITGTTPTSQVFVQAKREVQGDFVSYVSDVARSTAAATNLVICPAASTAPDVLNQATARPVPPPRVFRIQVVTTGTVTDLDEDIDAYYLK